MSAVGSIAGGLISGVSNIIGGNNQNNAAIQNQQNSEAYNTAMSDTQYQRSVADLEAAGLNPVLAVGAQDSAPTISPAPVVNTLGNAMNAGISNYSALQSSRQTDPNLDNTKASTNLLNAQAIQAAANTTSALSAAQNQDAQTAKVRSGSLMSDVVGSDAASKASSWLNNAIDNVSSKMNSVIQGITTNSGTAGSRPDASSGFSGSSQYQP